MQSLSKPREPKRLDLVGVPASAAAILLGKLGNSALVRARSRIVVLNLSFRHETTAAPPSALGEDDA